jgi:hypothetical protein
LDQPALRVGAKSKGKHDQAGTLPESKAAKGGKRKRAEEAAEAKRKAADLEMLMMDDNALLAASEVARSKALALQAGACAAALRSHVD